MIDKNKKRPTQCHTFNSCLGLGIRLARETLLDATHICSTIGNKKQERPNTCYTFHSCLVLGNRFARETLLDATHLICSKILKKRNDPPKCYTFHSCLGFGKSLSTRDAPRCNPPNMLETCQRTETTQHMLNCSLVPGFWETA